MTAGIATAMVVSLTSSPAWADEPTPARNPAKTETAASKGDATPTVDEIIEAAKKKASKSGKRVEIPERDTETTTLFANPDGKTLRMEMHTQPIRVKKSSGDGFTPIDTTLVEKNGAIKPKTVKGDLTLSAGNDTLVAKSKDAQGTAEISAPKKLPVPTLDGSSATYPSLYGDGIDLVVTATPNGFRQKIVLRKRVTGPVSFRVRATPPKGKTLTSDASGQPVLLAEDGKTKTALPSALLLDAVAADPNGAVDAGRVGKATVSVEADNETLVYAPDNAFLADTTVAYPVTLAALDSDWWEPELGNDTFVNNKDYPDGYANSGLDRLLVGKSNSGTVRWRGYIRFAEIPEDSPLRGGTVDNADLVLWNYLSNDCGLYVGSGITAYRVTSRWDVSTLTWSNQPPVTTEGADTEYGAYSTDCTGSMNYANDLIHSVDDIVQAWAGGEPNYGFQLTAGSESDLTNWRRYRSKEQTDGYPAHGPQLTVDFTPPVTTRTLLYWSESGPARRSAPSPQEALSLAQGYYPNVPDLPALTDDEAVQLETERGSPYLVGPEQLQPLEGEDWSQPDPLGDERAPRVTSVTPVEGTTDAPASTKVTATFDEPVTGAVISVEDPTGSSVPGTAEMEATGKTLTFAPEQHLKVGAAYKAEVRDARDASSNRMDDYPWSFSIGGLAASWTFEEGMGTSTSDSSGNGHTATLNKTASWIAGRSGNAISNAPTQALDTASKKAARQGKAIEVTDATSATSVTYAMPDGSFKTEITAGPVRTRRGGAWVPIDTTLTAQDGRLTPKVIADGVAVELSAGGTDAFVKMTADGKSYALRWPTPLPKPTIKGSVATYTDAAGVGADLVVAVLPTGFRHDVLLRQRPAKPLELRIGVEDDGLTLTEGKGGRLLLKGKDNKLLASAPQPLMWDGSAEGRLPLAKHAKVTTEVVTKDGRTELVLKPDYRFLSDPATTYPVRVDPTTTLPFNTDIEVNSDSDADFPADPTGQYLQVGTRAGGYKYRVHLKFDTATLPGSTVTDAKLSMNTIEAPSCGATVSTGIQVARLTSAWDPDNVHWVNKPTLTTEDASTNTKGVNQECATWPDSMEWNVTGIAQDWAAGVANHGLVLKSPGENNVNNYRVFTASEDTDFNVPPKLTITSSGPASAPTVSGPAITPAQNVNGATVTSSLTPQLAATVADTTAGALTGQFEVEHDPSASGQGAGQIWTGTSAAAASGSQAMVALPTGKLADGWKIRWRVRAANAAAGTTSAWSGWQIATVDVPNPTVGLFQTTPSQVVDGQMVASSLTPALHTTVTDPAAQPVRAEFEVEHDPAATGQGTGQIWTGGVDNVASGSQASLAIPSGKLTDGWKIRWRARAVNTGTTVSSPWSEWQSLTIDVPDPVSQPAVTALQVNPSQVVDGKIVTSTLTPSLLGQVTDAAEGMLRAEFEVEHDPAATGQGTGQIWTGGVDNVASGSQASLAIPSGKLTDGWKIRWRARAVSATAASAWSDWRQLDVSLPKPTVGGLGLEPSAVVDGKTLVTSLTPTVKAIVTNPAGQPIRAEFEFEHDPATTEQGSGQIWTGGVDNVATGTQASITLPDGKLANGWKIRWRARAVAAASTSAWSDWQTATVDLVEPGEEPLATTDGSVIHTDQSFTVAAWLRWADKDGDYSVLEQKGTHQAPFRLGNTSDHGLVFTLTSADSPDATSEGALSDVKPPLNEWFHLVGAYDATTKTASLYLNGQLIKTTPISFSAWRSGSALSLGASMRGDLDDTRAYQQALTAEQVGELVNPQSTDTSAKSAKAEAHVPTAQAAADFNYEHMTLEQCEAERDARVGESGTWNTGRGWDKLAPYGGCWSRHMLFVIHEKTEKYQKSCNCKVSVENVDEFLNFDMTVVMHTYLGDSTGTAVIGGAGSGRGPRDIKVWTRVNNFWTEDDDFFDALLGLDNTDPEELDNTLKLELEVTGGSTACSTIYSSGDNGGLTRTARMKKWIDDGDDVFIFHSQNGSPSRCTIMPWFIYNNPLMPGNHDQQVVAGWGEGTWLTTGNQKLRDSAPRARCDNIPMGSVAGNYHGGCVFYGSSRVYRMSTSNFNNGAVARHINTAFTRPQDTVPFKTDGPKHIPGNWNASHSTPEGKALERIYTNTQRYRQNVAAKDTVCDEFFDDRPRKKTGEMDESRWEQCDEFPFASTKQGAGFDHPDYGKNNFSVYSVLGSQNTSAGNDLGIFYARYRVLSSNQFWVAIQ
ncbi:DNRLRE domain-containing protein [Nonomuraea sp. NPDC049750]|uniref:DNRLRE domain-containing protein n=1 Tax=Nonomuraea sp. NPDC049750 TaxID=3154738 RepID=UPI003403641C